MDNSLTDDDDNRSASMDLESDGEDTNRSISIKWESDEEDEQSVSMDFDSDEEADTQASHAANHIADDQSSRLTSASPPLTRALTEEFRIIRALVPQADESQAFDTQDASLSVSPNRRSWSDAMSCIAGSPPQQLLMLSRITPAMDMYQSMRQPLTPEKFREWIVTNLGLARARLTLSNPSDDHTIKRVLFEYLDASTERRVVATEEDAFRLLDRVDACLRRNDIGASWLQQEWLDEGPPIVQRANAGRVQVLEASAAPAQVQRPLQDMIAVAALRAQQVGLSRRAKSKAAKKVAKKASKQVAKKKAPVTKEIRPAKKIPKVKARPAKETGDFLVATGISKSERKRAKLLEHLEAERLERKRLDAELDAADADRGDVLQQWQNEMETLRKEIQRSALEKDGLSIES